MMRRTGRVPLLLLVGLMVAAPPAAFASDFVTGVAVGQMLSDDSGSKKMEDTGPESKTVIDYHELAPPAPTYVKTQDLGWLSKKVKCRTNHQHQPA
nr:hypothetical protein TCT1_37410 [Xenorhabdus sp. TCT-1]